MADDTTAEAIAISTGVVGALRAAGVLLTQGTQTQGMQTQGTQTQGTPTAPPLPEHQVGDLISVRIRQVAKFVGTNPSVVKVRLTHNEHPISYDCEFPPSDQVYLPEFHRLFTIERPIHIHAYLKILKKIWAQEYESELRGLWVNAGFRG